MDAQHHLGQADTRLVVVCSNAVAAGEDEFGTATHAGAMHRSHRRAGQAGQRLVDALAVFDVLQHGVVPGIVDELLDVCAYGKTRWLGRVDDHARRLVDRQTFDDLLEFVQHGAGDRIDAAVGAIKRQRDNAFVVFAGFPVS